MTAPTAIPLPSIANVKPGQWTTLGWALRCFYFTQQEVSHVNTPFRITTSGAAEFSIAKIQLNTVADVRTFCPPPPQ